MSEMMKIVLTSAVTTGFGVATVVFAQMLQRLFIEPIQEFNKARGRVASALSHHYSTTAQPFYNNDGDEFRMDPDELLTVAAELRGFAAELRACAAVIPFYSKVAFVLGMPTRQNLKVASRALQQWASTILLEHGDAIACMDKVDENLKLKVMWYFDQTDDLEVPKQKQKSA